MPEKEKKHNKFLIILLGMSIISIFSSFYFFYNKKDFNFIVETQCNPETETCFYRDCTNPDDCPPNGFTHYNTYTLKASDFKLCGANEDCLASCTTGAISCVKTECTESDLADGVCLAPYISTTNLNLN